MTKLLLLILLGFVAVSWFKSQNRPRRDLGRQDDRPEVEDMVRCKVCGINLPRSEALMSRGRIYCCDEHRQQDHE